ncbi:ent-copalyl diphosphate synthase 1-like [Rutidosis leptorrhynchoides]|uniref:ent-copalyl diphosphate synthase 1-like n=1 Tax=Rutidosis leptorrhynchoides TaxID=125765 RepID=UPI003A99F060
MWYRKAIPLIPFKRIRFFLSRLFETFLLDVCSLSGYLVTVSNSFSYYLNMRPLEKNSASQVFHGKPYAIEQRNTPRVNIDHLQIINKYAESIKLIFDSMDGGNISSSAYDTARVALIEDVNDPTSGPQFPSSLQWIVDNQLPDGSWGETLVFSAYDRLINTLACVIALTFWNVHPDKGQKGLKFLKGNINKLESENENNMTIGFEVAFPSLIELARKLNINAPLSDDEYPVLKTIYARRDLKLKKIPKEILHKTPTSLLYTLEGLKDLEWEKLLKLQAENGSILYSPSSTAFTFTQTKDEKCLAYLTDLVARFNGGVPHAYPVDLFEHMWMIDRLQRLGIARYFLSEIKTCVDYIHRYWDEGGVGFAKYCNVPDLDDTSMGFRILRANGYQVSPDVFQNFEKDGRFSCYQGQSSEAVTVMFNLYRASQMLFPGNNILENAKNFSYKYLTQKRVTNDLFDKWIITKDMPGEVGYALDVPLYASLPRLEARFYIEQYGGEDDVWIGKSLYKMGNINNNKYLEMAKLDYNHCQNIHQLELSDIQRWYADLNLEEGLNTIPILWSYYEAAASIFEPERCIERIAWAKTTILLNTITSLFTRPQFSNADYRHAFVNDFINTQCHDDKPWYLLVVALHQTLSQISSEALTAHGVDIHLHLQRAWMMWMLSWQKGVGGEAELIVRTISMISGRAITKELLFNPHYQRISSVTNKLCHQISHKEDRSLGLEIESKMQELVQLVFCHSSCDLDPDLKQTFLSVAKTFYYWAFFDPETIDGHIDKVLFENVV